MTLYGEPYAYLILYGHLLGLTDRSHHCFGVCMCRFVLRAYVIDFMFRLVMSTMEKIYMVACGFLRIKFLCP